MSNVSTIEIAHGAGNGLLDRVRRAFADYRLYLQTLEELNQLSARELSDLGISRHSIRAIARQSVYGA